MRAQADAAPFPEDAWPWVEIIAPLVSDGKPVGVALLGTKSAEEDFNGVEVAFVEQVVSAISLAASSIRLFEASRAMSRHRLQVREQERSYLAALLHDHPLQRLTLMAGRLDGLIHEAKHNQHLTTLAVELKQQRTRLLEVVQEMRDICADLHPPLLDQVLGLAVQEVIEQFEFDTALDVSAQIEIDPERELPEAVSTAAYHVLREALTNVRKHAGASSVNICLYALIALCTFALTSLQYGRKFGIFTAA